MEDDSRVIYPSSYSQTFYSCYSNSGFPVKNHASFTRPSIGSGWISGLLNCLKAKPLNRPLPSFVVGAKHLGGDVSWKPRDGLQVQGN